MSKKFQELELKSVNEVAAEQVCSLCKHMGHEVEKCPTLPALQEMLSNPTEVNWVNNNGLQYIQFKLEKPPKLEMGATTTSTTTTTRPGDIFSSKSS